jgi:hypothetical protein
MNLADDVTRPEPAHFKFPPAFLIDGRGHRIGEMGKTAGRIPDALAGCNQTAAQGFAMLDCQESADERISTLERVLGAELAARYRDPRVSLPPGSRMPWPPTVRL